MRIDLLTIGNELLNGDLADTNTQRFARFARERGLPIQAAQTVSDRLEDIVAALTLCASRADLVFVSGGLGPTSDDLTLEAAAVFAGQPLVTHEPTVARLIQRFAERGITMTPNNLRQAQVPATAEVFDNPVGTAPHVQLQIGGTRFFFFPGVPFELSRLCDEYLGPWLSAHAPVHRYHSCVFKTFGKTESAVATLLETTVAPDPRLHIAYRAHFPEIQVSLHVQEPDSELAARLLAESAAVVRAQLGDIVFSESADLGLVEVIAAGLVANGQTLAVAESCTGGLVARMCTELPGSSRWFSEGFVTYANAAKTARLGVAPALLEAHGAVSEEVARAMAEGAKRAAGTDWALALTGIAGPDGGSPEKPVGTIHIALAGPTGTRHIARRYPFDRARNRVVAAHAALDLLRRALNHPVS